jgi:shikimate dehydrogenase
VTVVTPYRRLVLLGHPVGHSLSAVFQNAAIAAAGHAAVYEAVDVPPAAFAATFDVMRANGGGGNVTVPHKTAAFARCDVTTAVAQRVGAVNTFWVEEGRLYGDNTDVTGVRAAFAALGLGALDGARVALLGAGGAAASVVEALRGEGSVVRVWNRTPARAAALVQRAGIPDVTVVDSPEAAVAGADLIVHATPTGLLDDATCIVPSALPGSVRILDLAYRRVGTTPWVAACRAAGLRAEDGLTMLVAQGAAAFARWFGHAPDEAVMWRAVREARGEAASGPT